MQIEGYDGFKQFSWDNMLTSFAKINIDQPKNNIIYKDTSNLSSKNIILRLPTTMNKWSIKLLDKYNNQIQLGGVNYSFSIKFTEITSSFVHDSYSDYQFRYGSENKERSE